MNNLFLIMMIAGMCMAQDVKPADAPKDSALTKEESLGLQLTQARILRLQDKFKLSDYQNELQPIIAEQQAVYMAACKRIGIPEDKVPTECRVNTGVDADGKPVMGPDGKPISARVWREVAKEVK